MHTLSHSASRPASVEVPFAGLTAPVLPLGEGMVAAGRAIGALARSLADAIRRRHLARRPATILAGLDDHILRDIGVRRDGIRAVAARSVELPSDLAGLGG